MGASGNSRAVVFGVLLVALILAVAGLLVVAVRVLLLIIAGILFGIFLNRLSHWVSHYTPLSYRPAYLLVVVLFVVLLGGGSYYLGSRIAQQASQLTSEMVSAVEQLRRQLENSGWAARYSETLSQPQQMVGGGSGIVIEIMTAARWLIWAVTGAIVVFFVGVYVAYEPHLYETGVVKLVRPEERARARAVTAKVRSTLGWWIVGRLISMSIIGVMTAVGLWVLGVPLPATLGVVSALLTFIPNMGPLLATIPQALLAFHVGPSTVLYVILLNIALQTVESYLLTPMVQQYEVRLPPALTISVQLLMAVLVGAIGIVMAAPLTAAAMVLVQELYVQDELVAAGSGGA